MASALVHVVGVATPPGCNFAMGCKSWVGAWYSAKGISERIQQALLMSEEDINLKQKSLDKFYNQELSPSAFLENFKKRTNNEIVACNDVESLNWLK